MEWMIGEHHPTYGKVEMCLSIEGETYRGFLDSEGSVALIPLDALLAEDNNE